MSFSKEGARVLAIAAIACSGVVANGQVAEASIPQAAQTENTRNQDAPKDRTVTDVELVAVLPSTLEMRSNFQRSLKWVPLPHGLGGRDNISSRNRATQASVVPPRYGSARSGPGTGYRY